MFDTNRLLFRGFQDGDVEHLFSLRNDFRVQRFMTGRPLVPQPTKHKEFLGTNAEVATIWFSIILKETGEFVGNCSIRMTEPKDRDATFGIALYPKFWGEGYETEAARFTIAYAFQSLGLQRASLTVLAENTAAIALYKKLGFTVEGTIRRAHWGEGRWQGVLEEEWYEKNQGLSK
ncbi:acyl-CoA N-acyltransferase [Chiua virens]|nr:acyl-CoA N-acyltransferase [Chiua virens]